MTIQQNLTLSTTGWPLRVLFSTAATAAATRSYSRLPSPLLLLRRPTFLPITMDALPKPNPEQNKLSSQASQAKSAAGGKFIPRT